MYTIGTVFYIVFPTTYTPMDFINGKHGILQQNVLFYDLAVTLSQNVNNIWGAFPSYHNFWASLLVIIPFSKYSEKGKNLKWKLFSVSLGLFISVSTLVLHQHALLDAVFTYLLTLMIYGIVTKTSLVNKMSSWLFADKHTKLNTN